jgi:hypothetical protein
MNKSQKKLRPLRALHIGPNALRHARSGPAPHNAGGETENQLFFAGCNIELSVRPDNCGRFSGQVYWPQRKGKPAVRWGRKASGLEQ